jgi:hypothetical protein
MFTFNIALPDKDYLAQGHIIRWLDAELHSSSSYQSGYGGLLGLPLFAKHSP